MINDANTSETSNKAFKVENAFVYIVVTKLIQKLTRLAVSSLFGN